MKRLTLVTICLIALASCEKKTYSCDCFDSSKGYSIGSSGGGLTKQKAQEFCDYQNNDPASAYKNNPDVQCTVK